MGIPMDDIHTPTVPSGPVSGSSSTNANLSKAGLTQLFDEKERLEAELKVLGEVLKSVEEGIAAYFASIKDTDGNASTPLAIRPPAPAAGEVEGRTQGETDGIPFAKVNSVADGSPAAKAGLKAGDKVCNFGNITWANHENLTKIATVITNNVELPVLVKVIRSSSEEESSQLTLRLTPSRDWGGRGLLGCHLLPL
ncbi:26S proteasome non-ATPase regulatory subunit 9 [Arthroderma uncinatum]|uniref:26S proteasome non-ATPase regulatory subunit 9 n=1 Tax=Arthroderma uncinatum TaxID=74035 RepID=UPI00144AF893|nr:26S proteasome non-ATPase regulatory subunit 9 [Arthroderma uncinatum]KAF3490607.1 26S proteasome non-ATPase regulatory subunit 9 [Arthroderma uncinatum]